MICMTEAQAAELLRDLERESENLSIKAANAFERALECRGQPAEQFFTNEGRLYDAQSANVKEIRTKISIFLSAHIYKYKCPDKLDLRYYKVPKGGCSHKTWKGG